MFAARGMHEALGAGPPPRGWELLAAYRLRALVVLPAQRHILALARPRVVAVVALAAPRLARAWPRARYVSASSAALLAYGMPCCHPFPLRCARPASLLRTRR